MPRVGTIGRGDRNRDAVRGIVVGCAGPGTSAGGADPALRIVIALLVYGGCAGVIVAARRSN
jgi:hypothetical protein